MSKFDGLGSGIPPINTAAMREMAETAGAAVKQYASNVASCFNGVRQHSPEQAKQAFQSTFNTPQVQAALKMGAQKFADIQSRVNESFDRMGKELPKVATEFRQRAESARQSAANAWSSDAKTLNPQNVASLFKNMRNSPAAQRAFVQAQPAFNNIVHAAEAFNASAKPKIKKTWEKLHHQRLSYVHSQPARPQRADNVPPQEHAGSERPQGTYSGAQSGAHGAFSTQRPCPAVRLKENMSREDVVALIGQLRANGFISEDFATVASLIRETRTLGSEEGINALHTLRSNDEPRINGIQSADDKTTRYIIQELQKAAKE